MVLDSVYLELIGITPADITALQNSGKLYSKIHEMRTQKFKEDYPNKVTNEYHLYYMHAIGRRRIVHHADSMACRIFQSHHQFVTIPRTSLY